MTAIPVQTGVFLINESEVGVVNQGSALKRLPRLLAGQLLLRQLPQLVINQRQEPLGGLQIAMFNGGQDGSDFLHSA